MFHLITSEQAIKKGVSGSLQACHSTGQSRFGEMIFTNTLLLAQPFFRALFGAFGTRTVDFVRTFGAGYQKNAVVRHNFCEAVADNDLVRCAVCLEPHRTRTECGNDRLMSRLARRIHRRVQA